MIKLSRLGETSRVQVVGRFPKALGEMKTTTTRVHVSAGAKRILLGAYIPSCKT